MCDGVTGHSRRLTAVPLLFALARLMAATWVSRSARARGCSACSSSGWRHSRSDATGVCSGASALEPSNNIWLKKDASFSDEPLPYLSRRVRQLLK